MYVLARLGRLIDRINTTWLNTAKCALILVLMSEDPSFPPNFYGRWDHEPCHHAVLR